MADSSPGPNLVSMAQQFSGLPMGSLIGAPLVAAAKANQQMALTEVDFLMSTCFNKGSGQGKDESYEPVMIEMELTRGVLTPGDDNKGTDIQHVTSTIALPLLTILPLNSLGVDNVNVNFMMQVNSSYSDEHTSKQSSKTTEKGSFDAKMGGLFWSVDVKGSVSHEDTSSSTHSSHYKKSNTATYKVDVHAGQLPLPKGVTTIIQAYAENISPIKMPEEKKSS